MFTYFKRMKEKANFIIRQNNELLWAKIWDDTKAGIEWAQNLPSLSPGRWAAGYPYIYVMTRILNELEPHKILDLGLGISSTLISKYLDFNNFSDSLHTIVEHDENWVNFYKKKNYLSKYSNITIQKCIEKYISNSKYNAYEDLKSVVKNNKYSVISIDAPIGCDHHSRRDIVDLLPDILEKSFVIIMDDCERAGEKETVEEIKQVLNKHNIEFAESVYSGMKDTCIITSKNYKFLCSL